MIFYKIKLKSFPETKFAITFKTDRYKNIITHRKNYIEMCVGSGIEVSDGENAYTIPNESFMIYMPDMNVKTNGIRGETLYSNSVAVKCEFDFERFEIDDPEQLRKFVEENKNEILLPLFMELGREYNDFERLFKTLITQYLKDTAAGKMQVLSLWCEIVARVDAAFRQQILGSENENTGEYYSRKVKKYIETHYREELTLQILADMLNITPNYLSRIFKRETGKSITEVIARTRLSHARELVYEGKLTFDEIARKVGICNGKYMNKMFKKYYGISVHKCRLTDNEISLYHDKPWEVKNLTKDIYDNS